MFVYFRVMQAAMGLLLAKIAYHQPLIPVVDAEELTRVLILVLSSPLAQNQKARKRLMTAASMMSTSFTSRPSSAVLIGGVGAVDSRPASATQTQRKSVEESLETCLLFGVPQIAWPKQIGWLDGLFELAHCWSSHSVIMNAKRIFIDA